MRTSTFLFGTILTAAGAALAGACGGNGTTTAAATATAGGTSTTTGAGGSGGSGATTTSGAGGSSTTGAGGAGGGSTTGAGGSGGASPGALSAKIKSSDFYANCQPIVADDPVIGSFIATYQNTGGASESAKITEAKLTLSKGGETLIWPLSVLPAASGQIMAGQTADVAHTKVGGGGGTVSGAPCGYCNGTWTLSVTWDVQGVKSTDMLPASPVSCVF